MSYQTERDEFVARATLHGFSLEHTQKILALANRIQRHAVNACNRETDCNEDKRDRANCDQLRTIVENHGCKVDFSGDPRGYIVKIHFPDGACNTWGGAEAGWGVPTRTH